MLLLVLLIGLLICAVVILSLVPPVSRDALTHHLAVPKLYLNAGALCEIPWLPFSYYPMNLELLYIVPLYFGNDIAPNFIHFLFGLATAVLIFRYLKKRIDTMYGLIGAVFFLSLPIVVKLSISAYVDLGLVFFSMASILALFRWAESGFRIKHLVIAGLFCGLALGTKYNGIPILLLLCLFIPVFYDHSRSGEKGFRIQAKGVGFGLVFALIALVAFSPWMIRNYRWTKNPIYPLYDNWFNPPAAGLSDRAQGNTGMDTGAASPLNNFMKRKITYQESGWQIAFIPVRIFFEGKDGDPRFFDGKLNPLLFFLPFFLYIRTKGRCIAAIREKIFLALFSLLYLLIVFLSSDMRIRWIAPILPPLVILCVMGLHRLQMVTARRWIGRSAVALIFFLFIGLNISYIIGQFRYVDPISYITGAVDRETYIERYCHEYPVVRFANASLSTDVEILGLFTGNRLYYSDHKITFDEWIFRKAVTKSDMPEKISAQLKNLGFTHLMVRYDLFIEWSQINFTESQRKMVEHFFKEHAALMYSKNGYGLFQLGSF